jgi:hypothetical protein
MLPLLADVLDRLEAEMLLPLIGAGVGTPRARRTGPALSAHGALGGSPSQAGVGSSNSPCAGTLRWAAYVWSFAANSPAGYQGALRILCSGLQAGRCSALLSWPDPRK